MPNLYFKNVPDVITSSLTDDSFFAMEGSGKYMYF